MKKRHGERRSFDYGVVIPDLRKKKTNRRKKLVDKYIKKKPKIVKLD